MIRINGKDVEINKFPDGTFLIKEEPSYNIALISWLFENNEELVALIYLVNHLRSNGVKRLELYMPYIPNARQDRVKKPEDVFTLKYFAGVINSLGFDKVSVLDPHSPVSEALIEKILIDSPQIYIEAVIDDITRTDKYMDEHGEVQLMLFYPDEGAMKRYSGMVSRPYAFGIKDRDWSTGQIKELKVAGSVEGIKGSTVLMVDDICSRGGTFYYSALKLKELGAKNIILYVTHCENTILDGEVLTCGLIDKVYTTNSLLTERHKKIIVFDAIQKKEMKLYEHKSDVIN